MDAIGPTPLAPRRSGAVRVALTCAAVSVAAVAAAGCGATIINSETTTTVPPSTVVPRGDASAMFDNIVASARDIGELVVSGDTAAASRLLDAARANWAELEPLVVESGVDLREQIETVISLLTTAVERRRPADADKAFRFAELIGETVRQKLG